MWNNNIKMALGSLRSAKWRSFLTMLGIIVGVASVVTTVSIGEGVKQQVTAQINQLGSDLITVRPGKAVNRDENGKITGFNVAGLIGTGALTEKDWLDIQKIPEVKSAIPMNLVPGNLTTDERSYGDGFVVGTPGKTPEALNQKVAYGEFYSDGETNDVAIIGKRIAERLFHENVPIGKSFKFRDRTFVVRGVFEEFPTSPLTPTADYNNAVFIPYAVSKELVGDQLHIYQILVKPNDAERSDELAKTLESKMLSNRSGQHDFTILKQEDNLALADTILTLITAMIAGVAAVSLLVGGIGIMNIMLVSVTERTREIGIRKAVGATNQQIWGQFLVEAVVLSFMGGIFGVIISIIANYALRIFTNLQPVITLPVVLVATGISLAVGVIFGVTPALRAARKDPIEALRYDG